MAPEEITALGEALYGKRWRGPLARALGVKWDVVNGWASGKHAISRRYREKLRDRAAHELTWEAEQEFPGFYGVAP